MGRQARAGDVVVSLDKVVVVAEPLDDGVSEELDEYLMSFAGSALVARERLTRLGGYERSWMCLSGVFVQSEPVWVGKPRPQYRISWNPQTADDFVMGEVLSHVRAPRVTRTDVAIDYVGEDIAMLAPWVQFVSRRYWEHGNAVGSYNYGAPRSRRIVRVYDKVAERRRRKMQTWTVLDCHGEMHDFSTAGEPVTRVEATARGYTPWLPENLFRNTTLLRRHSRVRGLRFQDEAVVAALASTPWRLDDILSDKSRTRYRRMLLDPHIVEHVSPSPADKYRESRLALVGQLNGWLGI